MAPDRRPPPESVVGADACCAGNSESEWSRVAVLALLGTVRVSGLGWRLAVLAVLVGVMYSSERGRERCGVDGYGWQMAVNTTLYDVGMGVGTCAAASRK
eukprot:scaffold36010_cov101-Isochrysis_galbana.AAC.2